MSGNFTSASLTSNSSNETSSGAPTTAGMSSKEKAILMPFYFISLLVALIGNVLIIVVFHKYKPIRKSFNYFVLNMAISDLFTPLTIMPFIIASTLSNGVGFLNQLPLQLAGVVCKLCYFLADTSIVVSIISLLMISLDRLIAVVFPLRVKFISRKVRFICILMSWVVALSVHVPYLFVFTFKDGDCTKSWSAETNNRYVVATFTTFFLVPVCFLIIIYGAIVVTLKGRQRKRRKMSASKKSRVQRCNRSVIGLSVAILGAFIISIGPVFVLWCISLVFHGRRPPEVEKNPAISFIIKSLLVHSWGAVNPCVCFAFSENFRTGLKHIARAESLSLSAKLTSGRRRTRGSSSYHFSMRPLKGSKRERFKFAAEEKDLS
ncbi:neuropeptide SIFamide receptor-like [Acropora muricata]|uniref:neuropeptide SIFamide receptor-like n=1 Tax=Acropora muricata TaxID=159855 RepID=UPI0034E54031